jgi:hypothetical protein
MLLHHRSLGSLARVQDVMVPTGARQRAKATRPPYVRPPSPLARSFANSCDHKLDCRFGYEGLRVLPRFSGPPPSGDGCYCRTGCNRLRVNAFAKTLRGCFEPRHPRASFFVMSAAHICAQKKESSGRAIWSLGYQATIVVREVSKTAISLTETRRHRGRTAEN